MIVRMWHGVMPAAKANAYLMYLEATGVRDYRATPGNLGVQILRRFMGEQAHFLIVTRWESWEAIRRFAGDDVERAVYYPEDRDYLLELEPNVTHYEVAGEY